jgi:LacI family transcriptional regulator
MRDVAKVAGVSVATVSRVINNERYVRADTRERVGEAIAELGFQRNEIARTLRPGQTTETIALVIEDVSNPFYSGITHGVEQVARQRQHMLVVGSTQLQFDRERDLLHDLVRRRVDGLLVVPTPDDHVGLHEQLSRWAPLVYLDRAPHDVQADSVVLDNRGGARRAVEELLRAGCRRIAYLGGDPHVSTGVDRLAGYREALSGAGADADPELVSLGNHTIEAARDAAGALLTTNRPADAVFADNNRMTVGALLAVHRAGGAVGLAGFDDVELADLLPSRLVLVTYDAVEMGRRAAELLFARIDGDTTPPHHVLHPTHVTQRGLAAVG